jgi:hypothetical protein
VGRPPYGEPSGALTFGRICGQEVIFLARHGYGHTIPPHEVNYRANLWALKDHGVDRVVSVATVGGIHPGLIPGTLVIPDQIIDYTHGRAATYFVESDKPVVHLDFTFPYCEAMRAALLQAAASAGISLRDGGVYGAVQGPRLETAADGSGLKVSEFESYGTQIGSSAIGERGAQQLKSRSSLLLITEPDRANLGELGWRIGMAITALNFVLIALATTAGNPRAGRGGNLFFTLFAFVFYYNLLNLGQSWVGGGLVSLGAFMLMLHGGVFVMTVLWLIKRHYNVSLRSWLNSRRTATAQGAAA